MRMFSDGTSPGERQGIFVAPGGVDRQAAVTGVQVAVPAGRNRGVQTGNPTEIQAGKLERNGAIWRNLLAKMVFRKIWQALWWTIRGWVSACKQVFPEQVGPQRAEWNAVWVVFP